MVLEYQQVRTALTDPRFIKSTPAPSRDGSEHAGGQSPRAYPPALRGHPRLSLLDEMSRQSSSDLVEDYALPVPALVIAELLGVPQEDRPLFRRLSQKIAPMVDPLSRRTSPRPGGSFSTISTPWCSANRMSPVTIY